MKNPIAMVLSPVEKGARWTLPSTIEIKMGGAPGRTPLLQDMSCPVVPGDAAGAACFALSVDLSYEGVLGPQRTVYRVTRQ